MAKTGLLKEDCMQEAGHPRVISGARERSTAAIGERALRAASGLAALGVNAGDAIALVLRNDFPVFEASFAAQQLGAYCVPVNWHGKKAEIAYVLQDCGAKVVIAHADLLAQVKSALAPGVTLICCGGHFAGGTVLHWAQGGGGRGTLLSGDIVQVIPDRKFVTFMRSYPNMIPLSAPAVERIGAMLEPYPFDVIHGAWFDRTIPRGGKEIVKRSIARYVAAVRGDGSADLQ